MRDVGHLAAGRAPAVLQGPGNERIGHGQAYRRKTVAERQASDLSQMLGRAMGFHQRGQLADAEPLYRQILRIKPQHVEARHYFGILRFQQGRADEALDLIAGALDAKPDYAEAHYNRGNILAALDRYEEALASFDSALALQPDYAEAHHNHGNALFKLKRLDEALASYDRALALQPRLCRGLEQPRHRAQGAQALTTRRSRATTRRWRSCPMSPMRSTTAAMR